MAAEDDIAKGAGVATGVAAAACAEFTPVGSAVCALGAAIVSAFVALGNAIAKAGKDTFHPDAMAAHAWAMMARLLPASLMWGVDNTGEPVQGRRLMAYWRLDSGEVPVGKFANTGVWSNPGDTTGGGNDYLAHPEIHDTEEPLMRPGVLEHARDQYNAWVAAGSKLSDFDRYNPAPSYSHHSHSPAHGAKAMLELMRRHANVYQSLNAWSQFNAPVWGGAPLTNKQLAAESVKQARRLAGEHGPDPVLSAIFGDVSLPPAHDARMGAVEPHRHHGRRLMWIGLGAVAATGIGVGTHYALKDKRKKKVRRA